LKVYIDDRERLIHEHFSAIATKFGFEVEIKRLEVGDIVCPDAKLGVERKTPEDFVSSFDKIFSQCGELTKNYENAFLVIDGDFSQICSLASPAMIIGTIASLTAREKVSVMCSGCYFSELVCKVIAKFSDGKIRELVARRERPRTKDFRLNVLCSVPGISITKAQQLLERFGSVRNVIDADINEICKIPRIGPTLAKRIKEIFA